MITEEQIWNYLDGSLKEVNRAEVELAIADDKHTAELFREISVLHNVLKAESLLSPASSFTDRVMAAIQVAPAYTPAANISSKTLFLFALPTIAIIIAFAVVLIRFHVALSLSQPFQLPVIDWGKFKLFFVLVDILLFAYFVDILPAKRKRVFFTF